MSPEVQSGPDATSSNLVQGALQINQPRIFEQLGQPREYMDSLKGFQAVLGHGAKARITRSHEFEVGALEVTIRGEHFGTEANGNMVARLHLE